MSVLAAILGCSLAVGHVTLTHAVMVRLHPAQPKNRLAKASRFFYPLRKQWYIIKGGTPPLYLGVYSKRLFNDTILNFRFEGIFCELRILVLYSPLKSGIIHLLNIL